MHAAGAQVFDAHAVGGGDDGQVPEHRAAQRADAGQQRKVGDAFASPGGEAHDDGGQQSQEDRDRRAVHASPREQARCLVGNQHHHPDEREREHERVFLDEFEQRRAHEASLPKRLINSATVPKASATLAMPAASARPPPTSAPRTFWLAAIATTIGM